MEEYEADSDTNAAQPGEQDSDDAEDSDEEDRYAVQSVPLPFDCCLAGCLQLQEAPMSADRHISPIFPLFSSLPADPAASPHSQHILLDVPVSLVSVTLPASGATCT